MTASIVEELEAAGPMLAEKIEAARIEAEEMRRQWAEEDRQRREAEERARQQKRRQEARQELLAVISAWEEARRISAYFVDVEKAATDALDGERILLLERVARARHLIGDLDSLGALIRWKAPEERELTSVLNDERAYALLDQPISACRTLWLDLRPLEGIVVKPGICPACCSKG